MKNILDWLKGNWLIVVLCVIAIAALPTAIIFSTGMSSELRAQVEKSLSEDFTAINSNKVGYYVPTLTGERKLEQQTEVNPELTAQYAMAYEQLNAKGAQAAAAGEKHNKADHKLLIDGFFPAPDRLIEATKRTEFLRRYSASFHEQLLERMNAGSPPPPSEVGAVLLQHVAQHLERLRNERGSEEMNDDEKQRLQNELFAIRLSRYRGRANEITMYADLTAFDGVAAIDVSASLPMFTAWDLQERAWLHADVVKAIARTNGTEAIAEPGANASASQKPTVASAVVKRLIRVAPDRAAFENGNEMNFDAGTDKAPVNYTRSFTGRVSGPGSHNRWYDLRVVSLEFIASSRRLPEFIDALAATNFITVLELDLAAVDVFDDLKSGFYYGDDHVVRVTMRVESVMLRSWRAPDMPVEVQKALGMFDGEAIPEDQGGYNPPPNQPRGRDEFGEG